MEVILGQARRRWSEDEKRALVAETLVEGQTVTGLHAGITSPEACSFAGASNIARR